MCHYLLLIPSVPVMIYHGVHLFLGDSGESSAGQRTQEMDHIYINKGLEDQMVGYFFMMYSIVECTPDWLLADTLQFR